MGCITIIGRSELNDRLRPTHDWPAMLTGQYENLDSVWTSRLENGDYAITVGRNTPDYALEHLLRFAIGNNLKITLGCKHCPRSNSCNKRTDT